MDTFFTPTAYCVRLILLFGLGYAKTALLLALIQENTEVFLRTRITVAQVRRQYNDVCGAATITPNRMYHAWMTVGQFLHSIRRNDLRMRC
jgi:alpha-D-ribose 1-methylphosphonate 5-triphosphate synthase subunit PhnH